MQGEAYLWATRAAGAVAPVPTWMLEPTERRRHPLRFMLRQAGYDVAVADIERWTRPQQGEAYLWALSFAEGDETLPPPAWVTLWGIWKGKP